MRDINAYLQARFIIYAPERTYNIQNDHTSSDAKDYMRDYRPLEKYSIETLDAINKINDEDFSSPDKLHAYMATLLIRYQHLAQQEVRIKNELDYLGLALDFSSISLAEGEQRQRSQNSQGANPNAFLPVPRDHGHFQKGEESVIVVRSVNENEIQRPFD